MERPKQRTLAKILLVAEAFFGGFYVSITRGLFVPMLAYSGYRLDVLSAVLVPTGLGGILLAHELYRKPGSITRKFRSLLLSTHVSERILWLLPPVLLSSPYLLSLDYLAGNVVSVLVSILLGILIYSLFPTREIIEVSVHRSAAGAAASILGSLFMTFVTAVQSAPMAYVTSYVTAFLAGLVSSATLILTPGIPQALPERERTVTPHEEARIRGNVVFIVLAFFFAGSNLVGIAWSPLLRQLGAPVYIPLALSVAGNVGGLVGAYFWRSYRGYLVAIALNALVTALIPYVAYPPAHVALSFAASLTFAGANLLGMQVFAELNERLGRVRASAFLVSANYAGLLVASAFSSLGFLTPFSGLVLAAFLKLVGVLLAMFAIPETAVIPERRAYEYSRMIYSTSILGYTFTVQASRELLKTSIEALALAALLTLLYIIYRLSWIIVGL
ncbi:hypothetical protein IG193_07650 [Infirmifilum lucidum]|uniref:MFS transporter n=1 Tax=Infirmifilum lucidum TaxID=2776706 RepID=A0A7L9FHY2_9CREN|nr:hypothetical protein [Infirmifilum lucidum]QOJ78623.1 hypothetical protein IG193_07650 [Infirmifilum lucidum]